MKKDKAWLKGLINEEGIVMDMHLLGRHDEQYWKNENIKINKGRLFCLIDQLDEPEVLSQEWIDENKVARIDNLRKMTTSDVVPVEKLKNLLVPKQEKPVIPQFVADYIESQDDPIYGMCIDYEMWGVNGDDGTTNFTGEIAEWFDDNLNVENYYRACIDGYEVEKEKKYYVAFEDINLLYVTRIEVYGENGKLNYNSESSTENAMKFTDREKASSLAYFLGAIVVEVTE